MANSNPSNTGTNSMLSSRLSSMTYAVDHTGKLEANKIVEVRTLTDANRSDFNHIVPACAPYFANTLKIKKVSTNEELREGIDFYCVGTFIKATLNVADNHQICWAVIFDDPRISGEYELTYQTVGGEFVLDQVALAEALANHMENPRKVDWETIVGKPLTFPPLPHTVAVNDLRGGAGIEKELDDIEKAILALLADEEADHPGYGQVLQELFSQNNRLIELNEIIDNQRQANTRSLSQMREDLMNEIQRVERKSDAAEEDLYSKIRDITNVQLPSIRNLISSNDTAIRTLIAKNKKDIEAALNQQITTLGNTVSTNKTNTDRAIESVRNTLTGSISSTAAAIRQEFAAADTVINNRITSLNQTLSTNTNNMLESAKAYTNQKDTSARTDLKKYTDDAVNAAKTTINQQITTLRQLVGNGTQEVRDYVDRTFVKLTGDETVNGTKTFVSGINLGSGNGLTKFVCQAGGIRFIKNDLDSFGYNYTGNNFYNFGDFCFYSATERNIGAKFTHVNDSNGRYVKIFGIGETNAGRISVEDIMIRSDRRVKENLKLIEDPLAKLSKISGYTYNLKGSPSRAGGVIAQELKEVLPEVVYEQDEDGEKRLTISYQAVIGLLVEGTKELIERNNRLEERIAWLEGERNE